MRICLAAALLFAAGSALADEASARLVDFELRSLQEPAHHELTRYEGAPLLMVFFQPECSWCHRQVAAINEFRSQCEARFQAIAVGVNGNRRQLQTELRRIKPSFPAYEASPALIRSLGGVPATPFALLSNADGELVNWSRGFLDSEKLGPFLESAGELECGDGT